MDAFNCKLGTLMVLHYFVQWPLSNDEEPGTPKIICLYSAEPLRPNVVEFEGRLGVNGNRWVQNGGIGSSVNRPVQGQTRECCVFNEGHRPYREMHYQLESGWLLRAN